MGGGDDAGGLAGLGDVAADTAPVVLALDDVRVTRAGRNLVEHIDLEVRAGEHWALIGPNGAGKTTMLTMCGALGHPSSGTVTVLGRRLGRVELRELRTHIGHVDPRHRMLGDNTVTEVVLTGLTGSSDPVPRWEAELADLLRAQELATGVGLARRLDARWSTLSQGERGRALIARALIAVPALLLLDEPATGLDVAAREQLLETVDALREAHPSIASVTVTHHLEDLPASTTHAMLLRDGRIAARGPADDVLTSELVSAAFDFPLEITRTAGRWAARRAGAVGA
ncbi:iron complex transport system ATP-binding protein [Frondihabitans sp. PhB188]|uniref:ABC transporter ATP-binding protein n=1 Tax=Frondihabitans sp. PhB188 TaxID=2485200 RepID=UPI000FC296C3|nr:ATP-binding cassette domain-containing protein [Frondihabitans sp. PhB188]ROQ37180.1 iron complex transport system ATP-binding protein [Frondihabitans sp. PhB188]